MLECINHRGKILCELSLDRIAEVGVRRQCHIKDGHVLWQNHRDRNDRLPDGGISVNEIEEVLLCLSVGGQLEILPIEECVAHTPFLCHKRCTCHVGVQMHPPLHRAGRTAVAAGCLEREGIACDVPFVLSVALIAAGRERTAAPRLIVGAERNPCRTCHAARIGDLNAGIWGLRADFGHQTLCPCIDFHLLRLEIAVAGKQVPADICLPLCKQVLHDREIFFIGLRHAAEGSVFLDIHRLHKGVLIRIRAANGCLNGFRCPFRAVVGGDLPEVRAQVGAPFVHLEAPEFVAEHGAVFVHQCHVVGIFLKEAAALQTVDVQRTAVLADIVVKLAVHSC